MCMTFLFVRCAIQEVTSAMKQQLAPKKGLASTEDTNLHPVLLVHHTGTHSDSHSHYVSKTATCAYYSNLTLP